MVSSQILDGREIRQRGKTPSSQDVIVPLVRHLVEQGEKVIVFRNTRGLVSGCAQYLARELGLPPASEIVDSLPDGDPSAMSISLREALSGGVAFHNSDLNREERQAIERGFCQTNSGIRVLVATSTVAAGVNTPASTVVIVETGFQGGGNVTPYSVAQYKNMAGRAGRLGFETEGKAIVLAETIFERNRLFRTYVQGIPEAITSSFDEQNPGTWVIRLLAQIKEIQRTAVIDMIANTYGGYLAILRDPRWRDMMNQRLDNLLERMIGDGLIEQDNDILRLTMLGRACGESPLSLESALRLVEAIGNFSYDEATPEALLVLIEMLQERDEDYTPQLKHGESKWQQEAVNRFGYQPVYLLRRNVNSDRMYYARCKRALIVNDWIAGIPVTEIENIYSANLYYSRVGHGDIRGFADGSRYLLESSIRIASIILNRSYDEEMVSSLLKRLDLGIPAGLLPMTEVGLGLTRSELLKLWQAGITTPEGIIAGASGLENIIGNKAKKLLDAAMNI